MFVGSPTVVTLNPVVDRISETSETCDEEQETRERKNEPEPQPSFLLLF